MPNIQSPFAAPKYPQVRVLITGMDNNFNGVVNRIATALRKHGVGWPEVREFQREMLAGDARDFVRIAMRWFKCI